MEWFARAGERRRIPVVGGDGFECAVLRAKISEVGIAERAMHVAKMRVGTVKRDELLAVGKGKGLENDSVDDAEDCGVSADTQRERENDNRGEAGLLREHT